LLSQAICILLKRCNRKRFVDVEGPAPGGVVLGLIFLFISLIPKLISQGQSKQEHNGVEHVLVLIQELMFFFIFCFADLKQAADFVLNEIMTARKCNNF
jgi:hypothetical protein